MTEHQGAYRQIMKATSIFGGTQAINILISIIRVKFVAVLLGPAGVGILNLLATTISVISKLTNFGLGTSAVKDIAAANSSGDDKKIALKISVFRRLVWVTGSIGFLATLLLSPWLSQLTFGNNNYTLAFVWLSITLLFAQLSSGQMALLQGMRKLQYLAMANIVGSVSSLFVTLPFYFYFGMDGIVPGLIGTSVVSLLISWFYSRKIKIKHMRISFTQSFVEGKSMLKMGFLLSLTGLLTVGASYIVRIYISRIGGVEQVGLFSAGFAIINTYVGLVFSAMGTDYYPRLAAVATDNRLSRQTINQQAEIAILILAPILIIFLTFINWIVVLLYSNKFIGAIDMIYWASLGLIFKASSWSIGYILLAKGASRTFLVQSIITEGYFLLFNIIGYKYFGLTGLGISFFLGYFFSLIQIFIVCHYKYEFSFNNGFLKIFIIQLGFVVFGFLTVRLISHPFSYFLGSITFLISGWYSFKELDKRMNLKGIIDNYRKK